MLHESSKSNACYHFCHIWNITIYILVVFLAFWSDRIVHVIMCLLITVEQQPRQQQCLFLMGVHRISDVSLYMGTKFPLSSIDFLGLLILTRYNYFIILLVVKGGGGSFDIVRVASTMNRFLEKKCLYNLLLHRLGGWDAASESCSL